MAPPQRILIVRPSALGDVCRTVPVLASLRRAWPEAVIDWVVQSEFSAAVASHPALTGVVRFPRRDFARWWRNPAVAGAVWRWLAGLRRRGYELVIDGQGLGRSGLITWATRAPRRVGHRSARELAWLGYNVRHPRPDDPHTVRQMMSLVIAEGIEPVWDMRLYAAEDDRRWWRERRETLGIGDEPYAVLAPTARWPSKRWPPERWRALLAPLAERGLSRIVLVGGPSEQSQVAGIAAGPQHVTDLVGGTSVGQTMAVIAGAGLVVANDSAPLHMAVGFARPLVGLFGPTDPARVGPWGADDAVVRAPAGPGDGTSYRDAALGDALMRRITVEAVVERIDRVLTPAEVAG